MQFHAEKSSAAGLRLLANFARICVAALAPSHAGADAAAVNLYPAIDILGGNAVRLVKGDFDAKKVYDQDPLSAARALRRSRRALPARRRPRRREDAASRSTSSTCAQIAGELGLPVQYGGGLRSCRRDRRGARGGRRARDPRHRRVHRPRAAARRARRSTAPSACSCPSTCAAATSPRTAGCETTEVRARDAFERLREQGVRNFVFTNIDHDGMLDGADRDEAISVAQAAGDGSVILSGGIGELDAPAGARRAASRARRWTRLDGVIVGKALYERRFTVAEALEALAATDRRRSRRSLR